jgi:hypothetical protein
MIKAAVLALATCLALEVSASAGISSIWAGVSYPWAMGNNYTALSQPLSYQGSLVLEDQLLGFAHPTATVVFDPFAIKNVANAKYNLLGVFAGVNLPAKMEKLPVTMFFAFEAGGAYEWMVFPNSSQQNAAGKFALRMAPGFDVQAWGNLGAVVEFPLMTLISKNALWVGAASFSLRWKL